MACSQTLAGAIEDHDERVAASKAKQANRTNKELAADAVSHFTEMHQLAGGKDQELAKVFATIDRSELEALHTILGIAAERNRTLKEHAATIRALYMGLAA